MLFLFAVLIFFSGCSASSPYRFKQSRPEKEKPPAVRFTHADSITSKKNIEQKKETIIISDLPDSLDEFDELPIEENPIDKSKFVSNLEKLKNYNLSLTPREKILLEVIKFLDTPYKYGGNSDRGIDCSAFTLQVFKNSLSLDMPRNTREQYRFGEKISQDELKFGDLVFFNTSRRSNPGHVGIYLGENQFAHASRSLGVIVSSLEETYYKKKYVGARRFIQISE